MSVPKRRGARARVLGALAAAAALCACGYRTLGGRGFFGEGVHTIELVAFENQSREPGLPHLIAQAMSEEFARRGWLDPKPEGEIASPDLIMRGVVHSAQVHSSSFSKGALVLESTIDVVLDVTVKRAGGEVLLQHPALREHEVFLASADPQVYQSNKEQALRRISSEIAERVQDELFQKF
ncbi:MAG TPA: LPS assembly lipoprotein LptE [Myxococcota bacterium]|nr:LPS assembly lipoprotein LptE [Myxococcota bacterium]